MQVKKYDYVIFGAGIYGLFAAKHLADKGLHVALIEIDSGALQRASYINQARVHNGYHYPRSVSTAIKSAKYYDRFNNDFSFALNNKFKKVYAISANDSLTNAEQFVKFCEYINIPAEEINSNKYFNKGSVEATFETAEYSYDAKMIRDWYMESLSGYKHVDLLFSMKLDKVSKNDVEFVMTFENDMCIKTSKVLNATYSSINQLNKKFGYELFNTKYEICEVILADVSSNLKDVGITIMDGPFLSVMPFGLTGNHSLTSVGHTPHESSHNQLPSFSCQTHNKSCTSEILQNCNVCSARPESAWKRMYQLSKKFLVPDIEINYKSSLFAVKALISASELDDSRPTIIKSFSTEPSYISVFSGKFNTIYDLEDVL
ncbi:FAD-dependent oxidoreductase [Paenibacillus assamensis]|uniref:FAD-dependent oxidoreductase n=1 Tax=Paenibacillus assamensis TaxID=311244 RepID=UPI0004220FC4|nr:FAD-dependent oxidoreductase [Paenibacillus assamensis]